MLWYMFHRSISTFFLSLLLFIIHIFDLFRVFANWFSKKHTTQIRHVHTIHIPYTVTHTYMTKRLVIFYLSPSYTHTRTHSVHIHIILIAFFFSCCVSASCLLFYFRFPYWVHVHSFSFTLIMRYIEMDFTEMRWDEQRQQEEKKNHSIKRQGIVKTYCWCPFALNSNKDPSILFFFFFNVCAFWG